MDFMIKKYWSDAKEAASKLFSEERALTDAVDVVMALVMIVVVGAIGIFIADQTVTATGTPSQANLSAMQTDLLGAGETGSSFVVILVIAFIGGVAVSYMFGLLGKAK